MIFRKPPLSQKYFVSLLMLLTSILAGPAAYADDAGPSIADAEARAACVAALVDDLDNIMYRDLRNRTATELLKVEACAFSETLKSNQIGTMIGLADGKSPKDERTRLRKSADDFERARFESVKSGIVTGFIDAVEGLQPADIEQDGRYIILVLDVLEDLDLNTLATGTDAWIGLAESQSFFNFVPHRPGQTPDGMSSLAFPIDVDSDEWGSCDPKCRAYLDFVVASKVASNLISQAVQVKTGELVRATDLALKEYDYYFFETGDGLYPHELWFNSLGKTDDPFDVPDGKWTLIHPTPVLYYNDLDGDVEPSVMIEVFGYTHLGYRPFAPEKSLPFGGAFAVDLENDQVRMGGVVHLPIKGLLANAGLDTLSEFVPCRLCSVAFMTDTDGDWSIGLKIDAARLLYPDEKAKKAWRKFTSP